MHIYFFIYNFKNNVFTEAKNFFLHYNWNYNFYFQHPFYRIEKFFLIVKLERMKYIVS